MPSRGEVDCSTSWTGRRNRLMLDSRGEIPKVSGSIGSTRRARGRFGAGGAWGHRTAGSQAPMIPQREPARQRRCAKAYDGPVSNMRIGRQAGERRNRRLENVGGEFRRACHYLTMRADDARDAVVGGPDQVSARLHGPHPGDLKMLVARGGMAEPGIVGDVDEGVRRAQHTDHGAAIGIFVADGGAEMQIAGRQGWLVVATA